MDISLELMLLLVIAAGLAGFVDAISGGGGLIGLPALILAGFSPAQALGTNKLQAIFGKISAARYFLKHGIIEFRKVRLAMVLCFFAAFAGSIAVQYLDPAFLTAVIPWLILAVAVYIMFSPTLSDVDKKQRISIGVFSIVFAPIFSFYDGFFGPASGSFFVLGFIALLGYSATKATAYAKLLLLVCNFAAIIGFAIGGQIVLWAGAVMAVGQWIGARIGAQLVHKKGARIVKPMLIIMSLLLVIKMLHDQFTGA